MNKKFQKNTAVMIFVVQLLCFSGVLQAAETKESVTEDMLRRRQLVQLKTYFISDPKKSQLPTTPVAVQLFNQAVGYYEKGEIELAKQSLLESIRIDSKNSFAYELLGDVYNNQQNLKEAKAQYEIAYNLQPAGALKSKIEKLGTEAVVDKKLATYNEEHFIIKYHNEDRNIEGFELRELLRQTYRSISQDFGFYFRNQVVVLLYDQEDFKKISGSPHWAGGVYDGKIRMPINRQGFSEADLKATTAHEVTHAFIAAMSSQRAPAWLNEGLAQYQENKIRKIDMMIFDAAVKTKTLLPLEELMDQKNLQTKTDALWVGLFYLESLHLTQYLVERYGMYSIKKLLEAFSKGKDSEQAIEEVLRISVPRLEKEWRATFTK